jgi:hypothetical protein
MKIKIFIMVLLIAITLVSCAPTIKIVPTETADPRAALTITPPLPIVTPVWTYATLYAFEDLPITPPIVTSPFVEFLATPLPTMTPVQFLETPTEFPLPFNDKSVESKYCFSPSIQLSVPDAQGLSGDEIA